MPASKSKAASGAKRKPATQPPDGQSAAPAAGSGNSLLLVSSVAVVALAVIAAVALLGRSGSADLGSDDEPLRTAASRAPPAATAGDDAPRATTALPAAIANGSGGWGPDFVPEELWTSRCDFTRLDATKGKLNRREFERRFREQKPVRRPSSLKTRRRGLPFVFFFFLFPP